MMLPVRWLGFGRFAKRMRGVESLWRGYVWGGIVGVLSVGLVPEQCLDTG